MFVDENTQEATVTKAATKRPRQGTNRPSKKDPHDQNCETAWNHVRQGHFLDPRDLAQEAQIPLRDAIEIVSIRDHLLLNKVCMVSERDLRTLPYRGARSRHNALLREYWLCGHAQGKAANDHRTGAQHPRV